MNTVHDPLLFSLVKRASGLIRAAKVLRFLIFLNVSRLILNSVGSTDTGNCGTSACIQYNEDPLGWDGLGIGRMITFLAIDGLIFVIILILIELRLWEKFCDFCCSLYPVSSDEFGKNLFFVVSILGKNIVYNKTFLVSLCLVNPENGMVIPAEDDDVARERELIQSKPVTVLQKDNNLVIK